MHSWAILQVDRCVAVVLVESHCQARMLGQKVDPAVGDLGQLGECRRLFGAREGPWPRMPPGYGGDPDCHLVYVRLWHTRHYRT